MIKKVSDGKTLIELEEGDELYEINDVFFLIISKNYKKNESKKQKITEEEKLDLLLKLYKMKYEDRLLSKVNLSEREKEIADKLLKEGKLFIAKRGKEQYMAISKSIFNDLKELAKKQKEKNIATIDINYAIVSSEEEAKKILEQDINNYVAVKYFDKKIYIAKKSFFKDMEKKIKNILEGTLHYQEIANKLKVDPIAVLVVLRLMAEYGEVYESQKDFFCLVK
jgi:hypothetical protein